MARIRTIKPEFFTSLTICRMPPEVRLTFIGLWTYVDDEGRGKADARLVKAAIWPLDDITSAAVEAHLKEIESEELIFRYEVDGAQFLQVTGWKEHQRISHPADSKLPPCPSGELPEYLRNSQEGLRPEQGTGNREQGKEQGTGKTPKTLPPRGNKA